MDVAKKIRAIYDVAFAKDRWNTALDEVLWETQANSMLIYDAGDRRAINYTRQAVDTKLSYKQEALRDYNDLIGELGMSSIDAQGSAVIHSRPAFSIILDQDLWTIDDAHRARPEIAFAIERIKVFRRFYVNLSEDPLSYSALAILYPDHLLGTPSSKDLCFVQGLAPHLGKTLQLNRMMSGLRQQYNAVLSALDMIDVSICILDNEGRVILRNRCSEKLFDERDGVWIDRTGHIICRSDDGSQALLAAIQSIGLTAVGENNERSRELEIPRTSTPTPLYAIASPLRDSDMELEPGLTGTLLTIIDGTQSIMTQPLDPGRSGVESVPVSFC